MNTTIPDYEFISLISTGSFGYVLEAYDRLHDLRVAIKRTHKMGSKLSREFEILSQLKDCEYIVKLLDTFYSINEEEKIIQNLVLEYIPQSLEKYMEDFRIKVKYIPIEKIKDISRQILAGIDYCHKRKIVHRDLKPENILLTREEKIKICDFGSSKIINENTASTPYIVSRFYRAPELILGKTDYNEKIDIFSAGCIITELFTLNPLFPGQSEGIQIFEQMCVLGNPGMEYFTQFNLPKDILEDFGKFKFEGKIIFNNLINVDGFYDKTEIKNAENLILSMLNWDINQRLSAEQCLNHPFLKS